MMRRIANALAAASLLVLAVPALGQSNDDDYTPLNSRIKRSRQFPTDLRPKFIPYDKQTSVDRDRGRAMLSQFSKCLYNRSRTGALDLLGKTDFGFVNFAQIGMEPQKAAKLYGFTDCLNHVANSNGTGVSLRYTAPALRSWLLQAAYFDRYDKGPTWVQGGNVIAPRDYPLSANNRAVQGVIDFADCVVATDPYSADYFYRTVAGSPTEQQALSTLAPSLSPCLPRGQQVQLAPAELRAWMGEALWHAATHSAPAPATTQTTGE
jgi:hypothetical protein